MRRMRETVPDELFPRLSHPKDTLELQRTNDGPGVSPEVCLCRVLERASGSSDSSGSRRRSSSSSSGCVKF
jgi:hypothetical protein